MALTANEKILTHDYWKLASKLEVGDYVFDRTGKPVRIKLVQQYRSETCYKVVFGGSGSLSITGDQNLGFAVENSLYRKRARAYKGVRKFEQQLRRYKVKELLDMDLRSKYTGFEYSVPTTTHIGLPSQDLPVPPFIFGFWFLYFI